MNNYLANILDHLTRGPFTRRKLALTLIVAVVAGLGVTMYEIETASFALEKYAKAASILKDLDAVSSSKNSDVVAVAAVTTDRLREILAESHADRSLSDAEHRVALALILGLPWVVLSVIGVVEGVRREPDWQYGLVGCLFLAAILGGVGYWLPTDLHWFYRYLVTPLVIYLSLLGLFYAAGTDDSTPLD